MTSKAQRWEYRPTPTSSRLLHVVGSIKPRYAMAMLPAAKAAVLRAGDQSFLRVRLRENVGDLSRVGGDNADARRYLERALALCEQTLGRDSRRAALTLDSLGLVLLSDGWRLRRHVTCDRLCDLPHIQEQALRV